MADTKITGFTAATAIASGDLFTTVLAAGGAGSNRKITAANCATALGLLGQGALNNIASATPDLSAATSTNVTITGTTAITALGTVTAGVVMVLKFADALTFTHNGTSLILPGAANITTAANDRAIMRSLGSGNWECIVYVPASGKAVINPNMVGDSGAGGTAGLVPAPGAGDAAAVKFLKADATWAVPAGTGGSADNTITGAADAATDLAALNAAITAVGASATAPKTIAIVGTFHMGATRPSQLQYIRLDLTRAYMLQTANFTDAAPWLRGTGMSIIGGLFASNLGAVGASNSICFGDTATAGDGPCGDIIGPTFNSSWDSLTAARTLVSMANTSDVGRTIMLNSQMVVSSANRGNFVVAGDYCTYILNGAWGVVTVTGTNSTFTGAYAGGAVTWNTGSQSGNFYLNQAAGTVSIAGSYANFFIGRAVGAVTCTATLSNITIARADDTVSTTSGDGCTYNFGTVTGVLTAAATDSDYSIGTLVAAAQQLTGSNCTYDIGEVSSSITCSGAESIYTISKLVGAGTFSAVRSTFNVSDADSSINTTTGDACSYIIGNIADGVLTAAAGQSSYFIGTATTSTLSGNFCNYFIAYGIGDFTLSGDSSNLTIGSHGANIDATNGVDNRISATLSDTTHTITVGTRNTWNLATPGEGAITFATGSGSVVNATFAGNGADCVIGATLDACKWDITMTGSTSTCTLADGCFNNEVHLMSDVTPTLSGDSAMENIVWWSDYSTSTNVAKILVSWKGPNRIAQKIERTELTNASTSQQIQLTSGLPKGAQATRAFILNLGSTASGGSINTLTASMGPTGTPTDTVTAASVLTANTASATIGSAPFQSWTAITNIYVEFVSDVNMNAAWTCANGWVAVLEWA